MEDRMIWGARGSNLPACRYSAQDVPHCDVLCESPCQAGLASDASCDMSASCPRRACSIWECSGGPEVSPSPAPGPTWPLPTHLAFLLLFHKITPISIVTTMAVSCSMIPGIQPVVTQQKQLLSVLWVSVWQFGLDSGPQPGKSLLLGNRDSATAPGA